MTVTFTVDDGPQGSGIANVTCQVVPIQLVGQQIEEDSEQWAPKPCESPWTFDLEEGEWQISVTATDNAGRVSNQEPIRVWMDTDRPLQPSSGPSKDQVNPGGTVIFNITDPDIENGGSLFCGKDICPWMLTLLLSKHQSLPMSLVGMRQ
eukprot:jgi/Picre1/28892/NNA_004288.t1